MYVYTSAREYLQEMCRVCFCVYLYESVWQNTSLQLPMGDAQNAALGPFFSSKTDHTKKKTENPMAGSRKQQCQQRRCCCHLRMPKNKFVAHIAAPVC